MKTRVNDYPGTCRLCGRHVDAGKGLLVKPRIPQRLIRPAGKAPVRWPLLLYCGPCAPRPETC